MQPYLESEHTILEISYPISKSTKNKPAAQEKAHLQSAPPAPKPTSAKELFLSLFSPPPKKNKFPSPTPAYFKTKLIKALHITWVLQKRGWSSLALKIFALLAAKNHFVFYFFVSLKKRKWFLLGSVFIEILVCKIPAFAKPFPVNRKQFWTIREWLNLIIFLNKKHEILIYENLKILWKIQNDKNWIVKSIAKISES